jgi:hypothetical protein
VVHCTATPEGKPFDVKAIDRMHRQRGFNGIGYNRLILLDGTVQQGRPDDAVGAHVQGYNSISIGISYVGGVEKDGKTPKDTRTPEQKEALLRVLKELRQKYPHAKIVGHRDLSPDKNHNGRIEPKEWIKVCPSFPAIDEYKDI